jgi:hypothetical protein
LDYLEKKVYNYAINDSPPLSVIQNMPSLEYFIESLTQEKTKLINMGIIKGPRAHAITLHDDSQKYHKSKDKYK